VIVNWERNIDENFWPQDCRVLRRIWSIYVEIVPCERHAEVCLRVLLLANGFVASVSRRGSRLSRRIEGGSYRIIFSCVVLGDYVCL
jgi:hypothetical protein